MNRKNFFKIAGSGVVLAATGGMTGCVFRSFDQKASISSKAEGTRIKKPVYVPNGEDRFQEELMIGGTIPFQIKVSGKDTNDSIFIFEHAHMLKGGPPRHLHYEQDEWFYAREGEFAFEVGDKKFLLQAGDSLFAPRMIPHVWAHVGDHPGTLILSVQPAGSLEEFFMKTCKMNQPPTQEEAVHLFAAHGMKVVGPPLTVD